MLNIDLQQMLQEYPDDMEVIMFVNGIPQYVTQVLNETKENLLRTKDKVIILRGKLPKDYTTENFKQAMKKD